MGKENQPMIGFFYRRERLANDLSLSQATSQITTAATLSRFERGQTQIAASTFFKLMAVLPNTLESLQQSYFTLYDDTFQQKMAYAASLEDKTEQNHYLLTLLAHQQAKFSQTGLIYYQLNAFNLIVRFNIPGILTATEIAGPVLKYLKGIDHFGLYELDLLTTMVQVLPDESVTVLVQRSLLDMPRIYQDRLRDRYLWRIINNALEAVIEHQDFVIADRLMAFASRLHIPNDDIEAQVCQYFHQLQIDYHYGDHTTAQKRAAELFAGLELIGVPFYAHFFETRWHKLLVREGSEQ